MAEREGALEALLQEDRLFPPPPGFIERANANDPELYRRAAQNPEAFWAEWAAKLDWFEPWSVCWIGNRRTRSGSSEAN